MTVDWEGLKAIHRSAMAGSIKAHNALNRELRTAFPAILAQHERDQRVIEAALDPNTLRYGPWIGSIELDEGMHHGKILHIKDLVTYEAKSEAALHQAFESAVHDYIEFCTEVGDEKEMITSIQALAEYDKAKQ